MQEELKILEREINEYFPIIDDLKEEFSKPVVGQTFVFKRLLNTLLNDGHILLEGVPGVAKTLMASTFSELLNVNFKRVQFTPDLIPGDIIGTVIFNPQRQEFIHKEGPVFTNILLGDEINRAPAKVQSALLEAMQERQVTIGEKSYKLPEPFMVIATQNPIEQEGTYPLPEAELDRFMFKTFVPYPERKEEKEIINRYENLNFINIEKVMTYKKFQKIKEITKKIFIDPKLKEYILDMITATREKTDSNKDFFDYIKLGASPRATLYILRAAKANAFLEKRSFVIPEDIQSVAFDVLRHRLILSFNALADGLTADGIVKMLLENLIVP